MLYEGELISTYSQVAREKRYRHEARPMSTIMLSEKLHNLIVYDEFSKFYG